jgi:hypothetical protein
MNDILKRKGFKLDKNSYQQIFYRETESKKQYKLGLIIIYGYDAVIKVNVQLDDSRIFYYTWVADKVPWAKLEFGCEPKHLQSYRLLEQEHDTIPKTFCDLGLEDGEYVLGIRSTDEIAGKPLWYFNYQDKQIICDRLVSGKPSPFRGSIKFILHSKTWHDDGKYMIVPCHEKKEESIFSALMHLINTNKV